MLLDAMSARFFRWSVINTRLCCTVLVRLWPILLSSLGELVDFNFLHSLALRVQSESDAISPDRESLVPQATPFDKGLTEGCPDHEMVC